MGYITTNGIVIREVSTGEADKVVTLFTKSHGKVTIFVKGARRPRNKMTVATQYLCYSKYILFPGKGMYSVNSCEVIESFYAIRKDIERLTYSAHFVDIINDVVQEEQPATRVLKLFLNALYMLTKEDRSPELISRIFEFKMLSILGYAPYVNGCVICGKEDIEHRSFSFKKCGFLCDGDHCVTNDHYSVALSTGAARTIHYIIHAKLEDIFNFNVSEEVLEELKHIAKRYLRERLEKDYKKLDFLNEIKTPLQVDHKL